MSYQAKSNSRQISSVTILIIGYCDGGHVIFPNSSSTPVVSKWMAKVNPELFLRLKHGVVMDMHSAVLHLEPMAQDKLNLQQAIRNLLGFLENDFSYMQYQTIGMNSKESRQSHS
jgi:hypothetical protein